MKRFFQWVPNLWIHPVSVIGTVLTTVTGCTLLLTLALKFSQPDHNVYTTGFLLIALPALFLLGLVLIPLGVWLAHRRGKPTTPPRSLGATIAGLFTTPEGKRKLTLIVLLTVVNIVLLGGVGAQAIHWMDTPEFCGTACHTVMQPEYDTYRESPHARVDCVKCHIGPGASFFVRSKIDGLRQVWRTITNTYDRPVPVPVHTLRPSRDTCEQCHWPDKFHGNRIAYRWHVQDDEDNTKEVNVFLLKVGGLNERTGIYEGIHWHVSRHFEVRYESLDAKREVIGKITVLKDGEVVKEYLPPEGSQGDAVETRTMDCIDCHNRPTHVFDGSPDAAITRGLTTGLLDGSVKWLKVLAKPLLAREDLPREGLEALLRSDLAAAYEKEHPEAMPTDEQLDAAAKGLADLWRLNVYPERGVGWKTYATHIGHQGETPELHGCWRCHDEKHKTSDGEALSKDCELCHEMLAMEEKPEELEEPFQVLFSQD